MSRKDQVIAGFNRGAETYAQVADLQARVATKLAERLLDISADTILEIGCGTGLLTHHLFKIFPDANFLLTDISPAMLEQCRVRTQSFSQATLRCMDGEQVQTLPCFDLITSSMTMHWFKDFVLSLSHLQQKLTKAGRLLFAMLGANSLHEWRAMCEFFHYPIPTPHFPCMAFLQKKFPEMMFHRENIYETYPDAYTFLTTLKSLGATATRANYSPLSADKMRRLLRHLISLF